MNRSETLEEGKNEMFTWSNSLTLENNQITYLAHTFVHHNNLEIEHWIKTIDAKENDLYESIKKFLKSINDNKIEKLKIFLDKKNIKYEEKIWDTYE